MSLASPVSKAWDRSSRDISRLLDLLPMGARYTNGAGFRSSEQLFAQAELLADDLPEAAKERHCTRSQRGPDP